MLPENFHDIKIILASKSPRRQLLLKELGLNFKIKNIETEENFPEDLKREEIPLYLCRLKANAFNEQLSNKSILITADTIVWVNNLVLNKPENREDAIRMLRILSGRMHEVITAICLSSPNETKSFFVTTKVYFKPLSDEEIIYYLDNYKPYDKAGAYGIQEWIGYIGIEKIEGSYFNVMGLPLKELYEELINFKKIK